MAVLKDQSFEVVRGENENLQYIITEDGTDQGDTKDLSGGGSAEWTTAAVQGDAALITIPGSVGGASSNEVTVPITVENINATPLGKNYCQIKCTDAAGQIRVAAMGTLTVSKGTP